jgi:ferredoxin
MALPLASAPTRETYEPIGTVEYYIFYMLALIAVLIFAVGAYRRVKSYTAGPEDEFERTDNLANRIVESAKVTISNQKQFDRDLYAGLMHSFVMWGFLSLLIATTILSIEDWIVNKLFSASFWKGDFYLAYQFSVDALGLLFVVGMAMVIYRRYWVQNNRLWGRHTSLEDDLFVWSLFLLGVGGFLVEGIRILVNGYPDFEVVSFVGWATALGFETGMDAVGLSSQGDYEAMHWAMWWSHSLLAFAFIAWIPYAKPFHMLSSYANVVTRDEKAGKRLPGVPSDLDATNAESIDDFTWRDRLDQDACTKCGRCSSVCPAKASGRPLDPRDVILDLKSYREDVESGGEEVPIIADGGTSVIDSSTMESCMACTPARSRLSISRVSPG